MQIEAGKVLKAKNKLSGEIVEFIKIGNKLSRVYSDFLGVFYLGEKISGNSVVLYFENPYGFKGAVLSEGFAVKTCIGVCGFILYEFEQLFEIIE